jgi:predicted outer membrane lipoprotein
MISGNPTATQILAAAGAGPTAASPLLFWGGLAGIALGAVLGMFPLWKSATLSPDSIERRTYWTGCGIGLSLFFLSQLPDWRLGLFLAGAFGAMVLALALRWTNHIKIAGRVIAMPSRMGPDRPPALAQQDDLE